MWPGVARTSSERLPKATRSPSREEAVGALGAAGLRQRDPLPKRCLSSQAPVTWSACTWVSSVQAASGRARSISAASRRACSNTGSISTASRVAVAEQVGVGRRLRIEQLAEDHGRRASRARQRASRAPSDRSPSPARARCFTQPRCSKLRSSRLTISRTLPSSSARRWCVPAPPARDGRAAGRGAYPACGKPLPRRAP